MTCITRALDFNQQRHAAPWQADPQSSTCRKSMHPLRWIVAGFAALVVGARSPRIDDHIKSMSRQEQPEVRTNTLLRIILYTVVGAVLVVAAFGIYEVISTVVQKRQRAIAILRSMGFTAHDVERMSSSAACRSLS